MADSTKKKINEEELENVTGGITILEDVKNLVSCNFKYSAGDLVIVEEFGELECVILTRINSTSGPCYRVKPIATDKGQMVVSENSIFLIAKGGASEYVTGSRVSIIG